MQTRCPQCGKRVEYSSSNKWRPFCSERCKLIDLGDWIEEKNCIPDEPAGIPSEGSEDPDHFTH